MNAELLKEKFARLGARLELQETSGRLIRSRPELRLTLDVRSDAVGEFFDIRVRRDGQVELDVTDLRRREQHLLLSAVDPRGRHHYLCGHDEQHWFVAAIPEWASRVSTVFDAMEALKPVEVVDAQRRQGIKGDDRFRRKNAAYVRQGEWFFLPAPKLHVDKSQILSNEPLSRGNGSKPHWAEFLYRLGGETVYVCEEFPQGLRSAEYLKLLRDRSRARKWNWRRMQRNARAYVKGKISHPDHKTIELYVWHMVVMNTEGQSQAKQNVVFLD
ncbi:MAG TPA: hypothetical protein VKS79_18595 [Gemmataceae bacterium]|nr:hypothetical protein [Gemmataceae bacterium]